MKASELIAELQKLIVAHGDLSVEFTDDGMDVEVESVDYTYTGHWHHIPHFRLN